MLQEVGHYPIQAFKSLPEVGRYPIPELDVSVSILANLSTGNVRISFLFSHDNDLLLLKLLCASCYHWSSNDYSVQSV
jgi:hypothetical protein